MSDVDFGDLLDFLALDSDTGTILLYAETITQARKFMSAGRLAARSKPVIVIKAGRSAAGARAAFSHTGAMAGGAGASAVISSSHSSSFLRHPGLDPGSSCLRHISDGCRIKSGMTRLGNTQLTPAPDTI